MSDKQNKKWLKSWASSRGRLWNVAYLPAMFATLVIVVITLIAEDFSKDVYLEKSRAELRNQANQVALTIQGAIIANVETGRGLANVIRTEPDMDTDRFNQLAGQIFHKYSSMKVIAIAPDLVVSNVYPLEGNESVIGLDYRKVEDQTDLVLEARDKNELTIAGPVNLIQGGKGLIVHYPVYIDSPYKGLYFWGVVSAVLDADFFYRYAGLLDEDSDVDYALIGRDGMGASGEQFFGSESINEMDPIRVPVEFQVAQWVLCAVPHGGWTVPASIFWLIRAIAFAAFLLVVVPMLIVSKLSRERMAHLKAHIESQRELASVSKRFALAVDTLKLGVWEYDPTLHRFKWDQQTREIYGVGPDHDIDSMDWKERLFPEDRERVFCEARKAIASEGKYCTDYRLLMPDGTVKTVRTSALGLPDENGKMIYVGVNWDISKHVAREEALKEARAESERRYQELEKAKTRIEFNALHDFLTKLPNRRYVDEFLKGENGAPWPFETPANSWLLKIDLDGFKEINDSFGHAAGDAMLLKVADMLRSLKAEEEFVARVGGDEFIMLCSSALNRNRPQELAERFIAMLHKPQSYKGLSCRLGASIGISNWADAKEIPDKLRSNADLALYQSKQNGKGCFTFFSQPLFQSASEKRRLADDLLRGIEHKEFIAYYQGQYSAQTHRLVGAEALARWVHPNRGLVYPDMFIELADSLGVTCEIDAMVMEHALETKEFWADKGLNLDRVSVNVSAKRLGDRDLIASLSALDFDPSNLTFELVESTFLDRSAPQVAANIRRLREMGIEIEIDDFGTAYASIVSLMHLLPNRLKIDRELILPVTSSEHQRELVHSIIHIGRTLGIGVVAEGIESMEHADIMRFMGADLLQGYAFSRPMTRENFLAHHAKGNRFHVA